MKKTQTTLTKRGEKRRQAIIDAAKALFLANGYDGTSLEMIIDQAGGSRRSVYQYFGGKEGLFGAIIKDGANEFMNLLDEDELKGKSTRDALTSLATKFVSFLVRPDSIALFRIVVGESVRFPELGKMLYQAGPENAVKKLTEYLRKLQNKGLINTFQPELNAIQFFEMVKGDLHFRALIIPDTEITEKELQDYIRSSVDLFLRGIAVSPSDSASP